MNGTPKKYYAYPFESTSNYLLDYSRTQKLQQTALPTHHNKVGYALMEMLYNFIFKTIIKIFLFNYNAMLAFNKVRLSLQNIAEGVNIVAVAITTVTSFKQYKLYRMCPKSSDSDKISGCMVKATASSIEIEFLQTLTHTSKMKKGNLLTLPPSITVRSSTFGQVSSFKSPDNQ